MKQTRQHQLLQRAKEVLAHNWTANFTKPSPLLYPHQWNWDSGFIAIGYSHYAQEKAEQELRSLFRGQWQNGMVPQIVFNPEAAALYFPGPDFWEVHRSSHAPKNVQTSGITMPPVHATAALHIYKHAQNSETAKEFLREIFPKIRASHRYFYTHRDPHQEGLAYIRHPWESGTDNSPTWDEALQRIDLKTVPIPSYQRKDLNTVSAEQRPTKEDYDRYVYLLDLFRQNNYDESRIFERCPFLILDPMFNSLLCKANEDLIEIAEILQQDTKEIEGWHQQTKAAINDKLWSDERNIYDAYDLAQDTRIPMHALSGFIPLFAGIPSTEQAQKLLERLNSPSFGGEGDEYFLFPSYDVLSDQFDARKYWRGPVWINMNWLLYHGLKRYGFLEKADAVRQDILTLVERYGFYEYFTPYRNPEKGDSGGYGSDQFSWTAALYLDMLYSDAKTEEEFL